MHQKSEQWSNRLKRIPAPISTSVNLSTVFTMQSSEKITCSIFSANDLAFQSYKYWTSIPRQQEWPDSAPTEISGSGWLLRPFLVSSQTWCQQRDAEKQKSRKLDAIDTGTNRIYTAQLHKHCTVHSQREKNI